MLINFEKMPDCPVCRGAWKRYGTIEVMEAIKCQDCGLNINEAHKYKRG